ncbi:nuclease domain-containing protein [Solibacillus daqui]|uniref:nuclease domain-containing protein n=1 Tax=Solibacillus daqui TaxID=2912187 RepID=UPI002365FB01|nr:nuclease domain-containing protein [Solibacillus daqui]
MKARLLMVALDYDHKQRPNEFGMLPIKKIDVGSEIQPKKEDEWVIPTHYREAQGDRLRQVALSFDESLLPTDKVIIHEVDGEKDLLLTYDKENNIWYQQTTFSLNKKGRYYQFENKQITIGIMNAGTIAVSVIRDNQLIKKIHIHFVPSALKISDYEEMIADLYRIREELVRDEKNPAQIAIRQRQTYMQLKLQITKLHQAIKNINAQPHKILKLASVKKKKSETSRFDLRAELEEYMSPGQPTYRHRVMKETTVTYENELMKQLLIDLSNYTKQQVLAGDLRQIENEQQYLFNNSDLYLQRILGSITNLADVEKANKIRHLLQKEVDEYSSMEMDVREYVNSIADYSMRNLPNFGLRFVELMIHCSEVPAFKHEQSKDGIVLNFSYDNRSEKFRTLSYSWVANNGQFIQSYFNSYFGTISLNSSHVHSHALMYEAFHHERLLRELPTTIVIKGYVIPIPNGSDPVSWINPYNEDFNNYAFQFQRITEVMVEGEQVTVSSMRPDLQEFLNEKLPLKITELGAAEKMEEAEMRLNQLHQLIELEKRKKHAQQQVKGYELLKETIDDCLNISLFKNVTLTKRLKSYPTPLFLHEPNYRSAWNAIKAIDYELSASLFAHGSTHLVKTAKVEQIYEVWVLYKILALATQQLRWTLKDGSVTEILDNYLLKGQLLVGFSTVLIHGDWNIELYYEPRIDLQNGKYVTPDFVFRYVYRNTPKGLVILDAKYRDYSLQGTETWKMDVERVAIEKYGQMQAIDSKWMLPILHSAVIHCDEQVSNNLEDQFNPYHVFYNEQLFEMELSQRTAHKFGSIYMLPSQLHVFKNWFRMILEYQFKAYHTCWSCGEQVDISVRQLVTVGGYPKYHFTCKSCREFWVKVHCRQNREHLIVKHALNYHLQVSHQQRWFVVCPCCGDGR